MENYNILQCNYTAYTYIMLPFLITTVPVIASFMTSICVSTLKKSSLRYPFTHLCVHTQKVISSVPIHSFNKQIVPSVSRIIDLKLVEIIFASSSYAAYKLLPWFFLHSLFHFHCTLSCGLVGVYMNSRSFSNPLFIHLLFFL